MALIRSCIAREILDSRGQPTVEAEVELEGDFFGRAAVPSGASTGKHEAMELRDKQSSRFKGKGVLAAVANVNDKIAPVVIGMNAIDQTAIDNKMCELDGTENKTRLGANAILAVSIAVAKAASRATKLPIYKYVGGAQTMMLPVPLMNVVNGGAHANNGLDVQEFMIVPTVQNSFKESLRAGCEIFQMLKQTISDAGMSTAVGDEGGFAPKLKNNKEALELIMKAIESAGYKPGVDVFLALDVAATELFEDGKYTWEGKKIVPEELMGIYANWKKQFPLVSIEDGFAEDDWASWIKFTKAMGPEIQLVGDDLFVTNVKRVEKGIKEGAANALLVKVNQIGTLTETAKAISVARQHNYHTIMSHRSGETEDATIADLAVAFSCQQIKTGSLCRGERTAKYNQLLRIEEQLGSSANYWGLAGIRRS